MVRRGLLSLKLIIMVSPIPYVLGSYSVGVTSGIIPAALTANSEIFQWRWVPVATGSLCHIQRVRISASVTTTMFAAGIPVELDMVKSTAWTAVGTGGTSLTFAALTKRRTSMKNSSVVADDVRIATTAALGAGTKTLEGLALANMVSGGPITAILNGTIFPLTPIWDDHNEPLVLATGEGFSLRSIAVPATGTWRISVIVDWTETWK